MAKDPYRYFRVEARELAGGLAEGALALEKSAGTGGGAEATQRLLRLAHTLKGAARVVKQPGIADECHAIEEQLAPLRDSFAIATVNDIVNIDSRLIAGLLERIDRIQAALGALELPAENAPAAASVENVNANSHSGSAAEPAPPQGQAGPPAAAKSAQPVAARPAPAAASPAALPAETVRVELGEMDSLLRGLSETSVQLASLRKQVARLGPAAAGALDAGFEQVERELGQVRDSADRMRLVPVETLAPTLERAVRDAAELLGKQVRFTSSAAGEVRLEAHVLARLGEALLHVVRNAVAHGVEKPDERRAAGKAAVGSVELFVSRRGQRLSFTCRDDGRGIDLPAVRAEAVKRGLLDEARAGALSQQQAIELLLRGGLSTTAHADAASGRGVGLDVVRAAMSELRGGVRVFSDPGRGTSIELEVPVSLSAMGALQALAGDQRVSIPLAAVERVLQLDAASIVLSPARASIELDGAAVPLLQLWRALGRSRPRERKNISVILISTNINGGERSQTALQVESLLGAADLVVRPLPPMPVEPILAGASLDAEGNPCLLLEPEALARLARAQPPAPREEPEAFDPVLIVDDSLTTRMLEQSILESAGFLVETATSAEEGLEKARARPHRLFLVDVEMPGIDGFEFVTRTQADPLLRDTPAILVTSRNAEDDFRRGREAGARGYMVKGEFDQNRLLEQIRELVVRR